MHKNISFAQKYTKSHKTSKRHPDDSETTESKGEQHLQVVLSENGFIPDLSLEKRQFDLSEHTIKITSSCKSYSFVILRLHNDREEGAASKSLGFRCR
ncbi:hypothetical protein CLI80_04520 [Porphyromonas gingivalis]|nr:hypothetical protein CLI80_04520 [Porphyromonas gingivalis]